MASQDVLTKDSSQGRLLSEQETLSPISAPELETIVEPGVETIAEQEIAKFGSSNLTSGIDPLVEPALHPLTDFLLIGGPVVWVLLLFSSAAMGIAFIKLWQFMNAKAESKVDIEQSLSMWRHGDLEGAKASLDSAKPVSQIIHAAQLGCREAYTFDNNKRDRLLDKHKTELSRVANDLMQNLRSLLRPLEMIASLSPLLGLLGTVMGMIEAFQQMEEAGSQVDPSVLSGGIWQALLTTAVGLSVAIPAVMLHGFFVRK